MASRRPFSVRRLPQLAGLLLTAVLAPQAHAVNWQFTPYVSASALATDNVNLAPSDSKQAGLVLTLSPGFHLSSLGNPNAQYNINYALSDVTRLTSGGSSNNLYHNLAAASHFTLVRNVLFLDANANVGQAYNNLLATGSNIGNANNNLSTIASYSVSPYVVERLGGAAVATARVTQSGTYSPDIGGAQTSQTAFLAGLASGPDFYRLSWGLNYSYRYTSLQNQPNATFQTASATLGYLLTRHLQATGTVGRDQNSYLSTSNISGNFWSAGLNWAPSERTRISGSVGHRYFGRTYGFSLSQRTPFSTWNAGYTESVSSLTQSFTNQTLYGWLCPGKPYPTYSTSLLVPPYPNCVVPTFNGLPLGIPAGSLYVNYSQIFIAKNFVAGVSWSRKRLGLSLTAADTRQIYPNNNAETRVRSVFASAMYQLTPDTSLVTSLGVTNNLIPAALSGAGARDDVYYLGSVGLNRQLGPRTTGSLVYRYQQLNSNLSSVDYIANSLLATITVTF